MGATTARRTVPRGRMLTLSLALSVLLMSACASAQATPTPPAVPVVTAASTPAASGQTVTLAMDGQTVTVRNGERILLQLGEEYTWTVAPDDAGVISRVVNVTTIRGSQGLYEAHKPGKTTLRATGDPQCRTAQPPCAAPSRTFTIDVVVQ